MHGYPLTLKVLPLLDELGREVTRYPVSWACEGGRKVEMISASRSTSRTTGHLATRVGTT